VIIGFMGVSRLDTTKGRLDAASVDGGYYGYDGYGHGWTTTTARFTTTAVNGPAPEICSLGGRVAAVGSTAVVWARRAEARSP